MPAISQRTKDKISEQVLAYLFSKAPEPKYTSDIARELARDEEFIKSLMLDLENKSIVIKVSKNAFGIPFIRRQRWRLSNNAFQAYQRMAQQSLNSHKAEIYDE